MSIILTIMLCSLMFTLGRYGIAFAFDRMGSDRAIEAPKRKATSGKSIYDCKVYEARLFEDKLVSAGVTKPENMTICEDEECLNCLPTRNARQRAETFALAEKNRANMVKAKTERAKFYEGVEKNESEWQAFQRLKRTDRRYAGYTYADYKFQQDIKRKRRAQNELKAKSIAAGQSKPVSTVTPCEVCGQLTERDKMCLPCRQDAAKKRDAELVKRNAQHMHGRWTEIGGMRILRPRNIPSFAVPKAYYDPAMLCDFILWEWTYPDTGTFRYKQRVDVNTYESQNASGEVVAKWQSIHDPDTGEYIGDVKASPNGVIEARNPQGREQKAIATESMIDHFNKELQRIGEALPMIMGRKSTGDLGPM